MAIQEFQQGLSRLVDRFSGNPTPVVTNADFFIWKDQTVRLTPPDTREIQGVHIRPTTLNQSGGIEVTQPLNKRTAVKTLLEYRRDTPIIITYTTVVRQGDNLPLFGYSRYFMRPLNGELYLESWGTSQQPNHEGQGALTVPAMLSKDEVQRYLVRAHLALKGAYGGVTRAPRLPAIPRPAILG